MLKGPSVIKDRITLPVNTTPLGTHIGSHVRNLMLGETKWKLALPQFEGASPSVRSHADE